MRVRKQSLELARGHCRLVCVHKHVYMCVVRMCVWVLRTCAYPSACVQPCVRVYAYVCVHMCVCALYAVHMCVCLCVYVRVCM